MLRFTEKLQRREFLCFPHLVVPIVNILLYHDTFVKTKKLTQLTLLLPKSRLDRFYIFPLMLSFCSRTQSRLPHFFVIMYSQSPLNFLISLHAALYTESGRDSGQHRCQRLKNEFPSFLFHTNN